MELLETQDPERRRLIETSDRHKHELETEINELSLKTEKVITNVFIIGGSLALTYFVVTQLTSGSKKSKRKKGSVVDSELNEIENEEDEEPSMLSKLSSKLIDQATLILLNLAKEKLVEYLQSKKREHS
jgi:hypothetical protein